MLGKEFSNSELEKDSSENICVSKNHWAMILMPGICTIISILVLMKSPNLSFDKYYSQNNILEGSNILFAVFSIIWLIVGICGFYKNKMEFNKSILRVRRGLLYHYSYNIPLSKVTRVVVYKSILGKLLGYGRLKISCSTDFQGFINGYVYYGMANVEEFEKKLVVALASREENI